MTSLHLRLRMFAFVAGIVTIFVSAAILFGWGANIPWLTNLSPRFITMKPLTAVCFLLSGGSLSLLVFRSSLAVARSRLAQVLALLVVFVGVACLVEFFAGFDFPFENFLFPGALQATGIPGPGRPALASAIAFVILASHCSSSISKPIEARVPPNI